MSKFKVLGFVLSEIWNLQKSFVFLGIIMSLILALQSNLIVIITKHIVDYLSTPNYRMLLIFISLNIGISFFVLIMQTLKQYFDIKFNEKFSIHSQLMLINSISQKELLEKIHPSFEGKIGMWSLSVSKFLETYNIILLSVQYLITAFVNLYYLIQGSWVIGVSVVALAVIRSKVEWRFVNKKVAINQDIAKSNREHEYFFNLLTKRDAQKELLLLNSFDFFKNKWLQKRQESGVKKLKVAFLDLSPSFFGRFLSLINIGIVMLLISSAVVNNKLTVGDYIAITMAMSLTENSIINLLRGFSSSVENVMYINNFYLMTRDNLKPNSECKEKFIFNKEIRINNLNFKYPNTLIPALKDISFSIHKGEKIAILGDNAAGKSTLINILLGLYRAPEKTVFYDGVDQNKIDRKSIYKKSTAVFQDFIRYMITIRENIYFNKIQLSNYSINSVLKNVGLIQLENLAKGYDTPLGNLTDDSVELSGGQWQRLALARAFIKKYNLIVLDEPTSALDPNSELELFDRILKITQDKTVIIISHRVGIARKVDRIIMMKDGGIIETGNHNELMNLKGEYYNMWIKQSEWYSIY